MKNKSLYIDLAFCLVIMPVMLLLFPMRQWWYCLPWYVVIVGFMLFQRRRTKEIAKERYEAEIRAYKAQIKPHFLFNTLNTIYGLLLIKDEKALPALEQFISIVRYTQLNSSKTYISLDEAVDFIREYVSMQCLKLNDKTDVRFSTDIRDGNLSIPPMLLITFVENCFKHGTSADEDCVIDISITETDGTLKLNTENRIFETSKPSHGVGLENCRKRLGLQYPRRHSLKISREDNIFKVELTIQLTT